MRQICWLWTVAVLLTEYAVSPIHADETKELPDVVVTATRKEQAAHNLPYFTTRMTRHELLNRKAARTIPEALHEQTAVVAQKTAHGQGSPYIRGFTGFRTLLLVDNVRINNSVFREGPNQYWNTVDPLFVDRMELVKGPFSTLYGSDAIGGTLNLITQSMDRNSDDWSRRLYYRYSTAENAHMGSLEVGRNITDRLSVLLGYSLKNFGDLYGGHQVGKQDKTGYREQDWHAKAQYQFDDSARLTFMHQGVDQDNAWRTHKTLYGISWEGTRIGSEHQRVLDQDRDLTYIRYDARGRSSAIEDITVNLSYQTQQEEQFRVKKDYSQDRQGFDLYTIGSLLQLGSPSAIGNWIYGLEFYHDHVDSYKHKYLADSTYATSDIQGPIADDATYDTVGAFAENAVALSELFQLIVGVRYNQAEVNADKVKDPETANTISLSESYDSWVGNSRLLVYMDADKRVHVFAGISQGFRAPNLSDLTRLDTARSNELETPSPDLDPEHFVSYEVGSKWRTDRTRLQVAYFYTDIDDMIVRTPTGRIIDGLNEVTKKNSGNGYVTGIELEAEYMIAPSLKAFMNYTWMDGEIDTYPTSDPVLVAEPIDRLMPPTGLLGLRWDATETIWLEALCAAAEKADKLSTRDQADTQRIPPGGTPGYTVCHIRSGWDVNANLSLSLAVENVSNEDYRQHGSGLNEPGRNVIMTGTWTF